MKKELHVFSTHILDPHPCDIIPIKYGYGHSANPTLYKPHWDYYVIHHVFSGKGTLFIDDVAYPVAAGDCFLICPGDNAAYIADENDPWRSGWIGFQGDAAKQLTSLSSPVFSMPTEVFRPLLYMENFNEAEDYLVLSILYQIFATLFSQSHIAPSYADIAERYIREHFREPITVASLSTQLGITPRYLSALFRQKYGKTTQNHLIEVRLSHARALLSHGYSVSQTALEVGYSDPFVFSRAFCRYFGAPPKSYLKKSKE